jgi:hypothetical protein
MISVLYGLMARLGSWGGGRIFHISAGKGSGVHPLLPGTVPTEKQATGITTPAGPDFMSISVHP